MTTCGARPNNEFYNSPAVGYAYARDNYLRTPVRVTRGIIPVESKLIKLVPANNSYLKVFPFMLQCCFLFFFAHPIGQLQQNKINKCGQDRKKKMSVFMTY